MSSSDYINLKKLRRTVGTASRDASAHLDYKKMNSIYCNYTNSMSTYSDDSVYTTISDSCSAFNIYYNPKPTLEYYGVSCNTDLSNCISITENDITTTPLYSKIPNLHIPLYSKNRLIQRDCCNVRTVGCSLPVLRRVCGAGETTYGTSTASTCTLSTT